MCIYVNSFSNYEINLIAFLYNDQFCLYPKPQGSKMLRLQQMQRNYIRWAVCGCREDMCSKHDTFIQSHLITNAPAIYFMIIISGYAYSYRKEMVCSKHSKDILITFIAPSHLCVHVCNGNRHRNKDSFSKINQPSRRTENCIVQIFIPMILKFIRVGWFKSFRGNSDVHLLRLITTHSFSLSPLPLCK